MGVFDENKTAIPVSTGEKIKEFRLNKKLSQIEVSNIMGKSPVWLSKIETDQREIKVQDLIKICKIFQFMNPYFLDNFNWFFKKFFFI